MWCGRYDEKLVGAYEVKSAGNMEMDVLLDASTIVPEQRVVQSRSSMAAQVRGAKAVSTRVQWSYRWGPVDDAQRASQRQLLELWKPWTEQLDLLFSHDTEKRQEEIRAWCASVSLWLERAPSCPVPERIKAAKPAFLEHVRPLVDALRSLSARPATTIVVPDTNVALRSQDLARWADVVGTDAFTVVFVPGVLGEIDEAKVHRNDKLQEKARKLNSRIKDWRQRGDIARGVKVDGKVMVRIDGVEPRIEKSLSWLDKDITDDRIIASVLELQRREPSAPVILLTGDTLMLAKADSALIPTADTPEADL
jgi:hypothetical protein